MEGLPDFFVIYWAMPVAAGAAVGQELSTMVTPGVHFKVVMKVIRVGRNAHFFGKVDKMPKKRSFAKITVCGLLFAGNRVILMYFLITKDVRMNRSY